MEKDSDVHEKQSLCKTVTNSFLYSTPRVQFTFHDIDTNSVSFYDRLDAEVKSIYDSPRARKGRSVFSVRDSSFRGLVAEAWYIQHQQFPGNISWTDKRWHDIVINESKYDVFSNRFIEVKTVSEWNYEEILKKIDATVWAVWNNSSFISMFLTNWDIEKEKWFTAVKSKGKQGTFVEYVESGKSNVWWKYFGTKCIAPNVKIKTKTR